MSLSIPPPFSAIRFWKQMGMHRVVLARECSWRISRRRPGIPVLPVEVFIHGGMCISYSGRCVLSNHMTNRDANRGGCAQSCRWKYELYQGIRAYR
ncbi:MAG: peptidase U32 family protein [Merdibacter sp.]